MTREKIINQLIEREKVLDDCIVRLNEVSCLFLPEVVEACFDLPADVSADWIISSNKQMIEDMIKSIFLFKSQYVLAPKKAFEVGSDKTYFPFALLDRNIEYAKIGVERLEAQTQVLKDYYNRVVRARKFPKKSDPSSFGYLN